MTTGFQQKPRVQQSDGGTSTLWQPYEAAYAENSIVLPWVPRRFYQWRWAVMRRNPLCWRAPRLNATWGEALFTALIVGQMLWFVLQWAVDSSFRVDVETTGAATSSLALSRC
jgi:hypothetical protein